MRTYVLFSSAEGAESRLRRRNAASWQVSAVIRHSGAPIAGRAGSRLSYDAITPGGRRVRSPRFQASVGLRRIPAEICQDPQVRRPWSGSFRQGRADACRSLGGHPRKGLGCALPLGIPECGAETGGGFAGSRKAGDMADVVLRKAGGDARCAGGAQAQVREQKQERRPVQERLQGQARPQPQPQQRSCNRGPCRSAPGGA